MYLELDRLSKQFDGKYAVHDLSLGLEEGGLLCILGSSGCGKTTTLNMIGGFLSPDSGRVLLDGQDITALPPERRPVSTVFQSYGLFPHMSVLQNVTYGLKFRGYSRAEAKEKGYARTMFGRRRPMPELKSSNFMQRSFGERVAMNAPIQGTAADIIKIAMIRVDERLRKENLRSRLILQVHDELLIETAEDEKETVMKILSEEMHHAASLKVELEIDMHGGKNWFEAK